MHFLRQMRIMEILHGNCRTLPCISRKNAMLAMEAMRMIFGEQGDVSGWREALSQVKWEGRMEEILPDFYVDGAHNVSAVRMFVQSIQRDRREKIVLFSCCQREKLRRDDPDSLSGEKRQRICDYFDRR